MREINFYFATLTFADAAWLLGRALVSPLAPAAGAIAARQRLSTQFAALIGGGEAFPFPSARAALLGLFEALAFNRGDEVLVTGYTCVAVPYAVAVGGLRPVYVDIDDRFCTDAASAAARITPRTRALIVQHTYGIRANLDRLLALARERQLVVIEDCAQVPPARGIAARADASVFSFELSKPITTGWGGMALVSNAELANRVGTGPYARLVEAPRLAQMRMHLQTALSAVLYHPAVSSLGKYALAVLFRTGLFERSTLPHESTGAIDDRYRRHMTGTQARLAMRQLNRIDSMNARRARAVSVYRGLSGAAVPDDQDATTLLRFPLRVDKPQAAVEYFAARGIELGRWFNAPVAPEPSGLLAYARGCCPRGERAASEIVNLPTHVRLSEADVLRIADVAREYIRHAGSAEHTAAHAHAAAGVSGTRA